MDTPPRIPVFPPLARFSAPLRGRGRRLAGMIAPLALYGIFSMGCAEMGAAKEAPPAATSPFSYADVADLAGHADVVAVARPRSLAKIDPKAMASPAGMQRFYVEAQVQSLIRGEAGLPNRIFFLLDLPLTTKPSSVKSQTLVLFGRMGTRPGEFQLLSSEAMLPWSPATEAKVRSITTELVAKDAPPEIARVVEAFHVEGTVAGESETQIFLSTRSGRPVSLSIIRRPSEEPRFGAALGEIVDEAANLPAPDTLLWYRLACGLPPALPMAAAMKLDASGAEAAAGDYRSFMGKLAPCTRTRQPAPAAPLGNGAAGG